MGFLEFKFQKYLKQVSSPGVLTVISNKASLQNGFGAYERIELFCDYDTQAKKTLGYSVNEPIPRPAITAPPTATPPSDRSDEPAQIGPMPHPEPTRAAAPPVATAEAASTPPSAADVLDDLTPVRSVDAQAAHRQFVPS